MGVLILHIVKFKSLIILIELMKKKLELSLQEKYAPHSVCFGCGPANKKGFRIKSKVNGENVELDFKPKKYHHVFEGYVSGGVLSVILDCHSNWSAAYYIMKKGGYDKLPATVTAQYTVTFLKPTPLDTVLHLKTHAIEIHENKAEVETLLEANGEITATAKGIFVAVRKGHPAYDRWR